MEHSLWLGQYLDNDLEWRTTASTNYDELVVDLEENWPVSTGIQVRKLSNGTLQFYAYVLKDEPDRPDCLRRFSEGDWRMIKTGSRESSHH